MLILRNFKKRTLLFTFSLCFLYPHLAFSAPASNNPINATIIVTNLLLLDDASDTAPSLADLLFGKTVYEDVYFEAFQEDSVSTLFFNVNNTLSITDMSITHNISYQLEDNHVTYIYSMNNQFIYVLDKQTDKYIRLKPTNGSGTSLTYYFNKADAEASITPDIIPGGSFSKRLIK